MKPRPFGDTGLSTSPMGLGLAALGRPAYITIGHGKDLPNERSVEGLRRRARDVLDAAWNRGIRYIDAARSYGRAEQFLGNWLAGRPSIAEHVTVGSKWGYVYTGEWRLHVDQHEVKNHSLETFNRQIVETRQNLAEYLDLYQIHSATLTTGVLDDTHVLTALHKLAERGVVVGLTLSGRNQAETLERALNRAQDGSAPFQSVQATWNLLETSAATALQEAADAGWGVIIKEAVANGRLTRKNEIAPRLDAAAGAHETTVDALAIAAALAQPFTSVVLSGAATIAHLESNLGAVDLELQPGVLAELEQLAEPSEKYWDTRSRLEWT